MQRHTLAYVRLRATRSTASSTSSGVGSLLALARSLGAPLAFAGGLYMIYCLDRKIGVLNGKLTASVLDDKLDALCQTVDRKFNELDVKFEEHDVKFDRKFKEHDAKLDAIIELLYRAFPALHGDPASDSDFGTVTVVEADGKLFLLSCANVLLHTDVLSGSIKLRLPEGFRARCVLLRTAYIDGGETPAEADVCLVEVEPLDAVSRFKAVHLPTATPTVKVGTAVGGVSNTSGECHGRVVKLIDGVPIMQGVASPGTCGTLLFAASDSPVGLLSGLDPESTAALPTSLSGVAAFARDLVRSMDCQRYLVAPLPGSAEIAGAAPVPISQPTVEPAALVRVGVATDGSTLQLPPWLATRAVSRARATKNLILI
jgi:hypothetical protein